DSADEVFSPNVRAAVGAAQLPPWSRRRVRPAGSAGHRCPRNPVRPVSAAAPAEESVRCAWPAARAATTRSGDAGCTTTTETTTEPGEPATTHGPLGRATTVVECRHILAYG